jgi:predicted DNA-binding transcriptional regulator YafY
MRADRLLSIVLLLQTHHQLTARDLAERLDVSERTIHRDMDALSYAGIPVVAERGTGGGWSLLGEYRTNLTGLNESEIQALFITKTPLRVLSDLKMEKAAEGAILKLLAALPTMHRRSAERVRQRIHIDPTGWHRADEAVPLLPQLQEAIWLERKLRFCYRSGPGCDDVVRLVDPLGLVAKGSAWYLVAGIDGGIRGYRVSRIQSIDVLDDPVVYPQAFDLATYWEQSAAQFKATLPSYRTTMKARPDIFHRLSVGGRFVRIEAVGEPEQDGWIPVKLRFDVEEMACEYALSFGPALVVVEPEVLRRKVLEAARQVVSNYNNARC